MIAKAKHKSGSSGRSIGYILGDMEEKDQRVRIIGYNGFALSRLKIAEIEKVPSSKKERNEHKKEVWKIANELSEVFDARALIADDRVIEPFEEYIISCVDDERARLRRTPTKEERERYGMQVLKEGETDDRPLERIILDEFLAEIGVHGDIEKTLRRKRDGKKYTVKKTIHREALFLAAAHDGKSHPHLHVFTARPDEDGKVNDTRNERYRILAVVKKLSKIYNLTLRLENYEVDLDNTNEGYATFIRMRNAVKAVLLYASSHEELTNELAGMGIIPAWKTHETTQKEYGIVFTAIDKSGREHTFSGSQLDRSLSYKKVEEALARNLTERQAKEDAIELALAQQESLAFARRKENDNIIKEMVVGYNSIVPSIEESFKALKSSTNQLYREAKDAGLSLSVETSAKYRELSNTWKAFDKQRTKLSAVMVAEEITELIGGALMCLNPIVGITVMFLASIAGDIHRASLVAQKKLLVQVESLRDELTALEAEKTALTIQKQERLQRYLEAKHMYQEYRDGLQTVDREVAAIKSELRAAEERDFICRYVQSDQAKGLLDFVNSGFDETHYSLVPGPLVETKTGMRLVLYTDGYRSPDDHNRILYHQHDSAPQDYGESYIDFSIDERGNLIAAIESDPTNRYTRGLTGKVNITTGEGTITIRKYRGSEKDEYCRLQERANFTDAENKQKPRRNTSYGPKL